MNKKPSIPSIKKLYHEKKLDEDQQIALLSFACNMFCYEEDNRFSTIQKAIAKEFPELGRVSREVPRNLLREAAHQGLLTYRPPHANQMAMALADQFEFDRKAICVVHSRSINQVAEETADRLIKQIRAFKTYGNLDTVHIGFAGGRLLRLVAENLATRLREHSNENPHTIVFHAMVAAYGFDDFEADPNSFITYFLKDSLSVDIRFVPIGAPGIVETEYRDSLRKFHMIDKVFEGADDLNIIVSGAGDWADEHSTSQRYLKSVDENDFRTLSEYRAVGDLLWQPLTEDGPIDMDSGEFKFRPNTLVDLKDLPAMIRDRNVRVLLALGPCGRCGKHKGRLLSTILSQSPSLVTDVVTTSSAASEALRLCYEQESAAPRSAK